MDFLTFGISVKTTIMKLRLSLLLFCLLGIGVFSHAQDKKKVPAKPVVEEGTDAIPVTVKSTKKAHKLKPPPPPPLKPEVTKFTPPKIVKDGKTPPPPPPKPKTAPEKPAEPSVIHEIPEVPELYLQYQLISKEMKTSFAGLA